MEPDEAKKLDNVCRITIKGTPQEVSWWVGRFALLMDQTKDKIEWTDGPYEIRINLPPMTKVT